MAFVAVTMHVDASGDEDAGPPSLVACGGAASLSDVAPGDAGGPDAGGSSVGVADVAASDEQATTALATDANAIHPTTRADITNDDRATLVPLSYPMAVTKSACFYGKL
jgi:hypothetical protein